MYHRQINWSLDASFTGSNRLSRLILHLLPTSVPRTEGRFKQLLKNMGQTGLRVALRPVWATWLTLLLQERQNPCGQLPWPNFPQPSEEIFLPCFWLVLHITNQLLRKQERKLMLGSGLATAYHLDYKSTGRSELKGPRKCCPKGPCWEKEEGRLVHHCQIPGLPVGRTLTKPQ